MQSQPLSQNVLDILVTLLGSQATKEGETMPPKSKNQCTSHAIAPSQGAAADASSLREVRLEKEVEQAPQQMKELFEMMRGMQQNQDNLAQAI
nr:hypothetical protein CFP56_73499 [Quercus suber]